MFNKLYARSGGLKVTAGFRLGRFYVQNTRVLQCGCSVSAQDYDSLVRQAPSSRYEYATESFVDSFIRAKEVSVHVDSLKSVWFVSIPFAAVDVLLLIMEKEIPP